MLQTKGVEKIKNTYLQFNNCFFENCVVYGIMWKNIILARQAAYVEKYDTARPTTTDNVTQRMRIAFCIPKATDRNSRARNTHCSSMITMFMRTRLSVTLYVYCLSCYWVTVFIYSFGLNFRISGVHTHRMLNDSTNEHTGRRDTRTHETRCSTTVTIYVSCSHVPTAHPHACGRRGARRLNPTYLQFEYKMKSTFNDTVPTVNDASNKRQEHNEQEFWNNAGIV
jgi:hypothetical protein